MNAQLSRGCLKPYLTDPEYKLTGNVFQLLHITPAGASTGVNGQQVTRLRLLVSDGEYYMQCTVITNLNEELLSGKYPAYSIIRVTDHGTNKMSDSKWVMIITGMELLATPGHAIGNPVQISTPNNIHNDRPWSTAQESMRSGAQAQPAASSAAAAAAAPRPGGMAGGMGGGSFGGPVVRAPGGVGSAPITPLAALNPYSNRWTIRVRVTSKGSIREWNKPSGSGKLFSADLLDEQGMEIRCTFFQRGVDLFYDKLVQDGVYLMSGGKLKVSNKQYTSIKHDYEVQFDEKATIEPVEDSRAIKRVAYNFVKLDRLEAMEPKSTIDVAGLVVTSNGEQEITTKAGKQMGKKDLAIADETGTQVNLTLWGEKAKMVVNPGDVITVKGATVGDFGGRSLSSSFSAIVNINPQDVPQTGALQAWWSQSGGAGLRSISEQRGGAGGAGGANSAEAQAAAKVELRKHVADLRDEALAQSVDSRGQPGATVVVKATLVNVRSDADKLWYAACPNIVPGGGGKDRSCNKKVTELGQNAWSCGNCGMLGENVGPVYRYIMSAQIGDATGTNYVTLFDQEATQLLGMGANQLHSIVAGGGGDGGSPEFEAIMKRPLFTEGLFTVKVKLERVKDEDRIKGTVLRFQPIDYAKESRVLLDAIKKYQPTLN